MEGVAAFGIAHVVRATVLLAVGLLMALALRRSAAALRHALWVGVIAGLLLLPLAGALLPPLELHWLPATPVRVVGPPSYGTPAPPLAPWLPPVGVPVTPPLPQVEVPGQAPFVEKAPPPAPVSPVWAALGGLWALGVVVVLVRAGRNRWRAGRLRAGTVPADPIIWPAPPGVDVREGEAIELPMTVGALRPVILVPAIEGRRWPAAWRAAVLEHEAAHVRRRDPLWQVLAEVACALYWFHPLSWLVARQLRTERELAADDDVLRSTLPPSEYAELLLTLGCLPASPPAGGAVLPLLTPAGLKARLHGIVDPGRPRTARLAACAALALFGSLLFVPAAGAVLVQRARSGTYPGMVLACARGAAGEPIAGAEADVWDRFELAERVTTDRRGCLRWFREAPHTGQLVVYVRRGELAGRLSIFPSAYGTRLPATIEVRPARAISGRLLDEAGRPLPGALVRVVWAQPWAQGPGPDAFALAGPDGRFTFPGLLYGTYRLYFEGPAGGTATELVEIKEADVTDLLVTIPKAPPVTGYLLAPSRQPVVGARVEDWPIYPMEAGRRLRGRHIEWDLSDGDGAFRVAFIGRMLRATGRDGQGRLLSAAFPDWDHPPSVVHPGALDAGRPAAPDTIIMQPAGVVRGVARFPDGQPAAGAYLSGVVFKFGRAIRSELSVHADADEQGRFVLGPLPLGPVRLRTVAGPRSEPPYRIRGLQRDVTVTGEHDPPVDLTLDWLTEASLAPPL